MADLEHSSSPDEDLAELNDLLAAMSAGDSEAEGRLLELVHARMRSIARRMMRSERPGHTLQPTALVHEAWMKISGGRAQNFQNREHFFNVAATAMRRILVDHARSRLRQRRRADADDLQRLEAASVVQDRTEELISLDQALERLGRTSTRLAKIVELRCFCDLTVPEIANVLDISPTTVKRELQTARAMLEEDLKRNG